MMMMQQQQMDPMAMQMQHPGGQIGGYGFAAKP